MIWTLVAFAITFFVLKRYAFGPIQKLIDERRDRIRQSIEEADRAREEARSLLEEHRQLIGQAKSEAESILAEARKVADAQRERMREETEEDRQRRLEETRAPDRAGDGAGARTRSAQEVGTPVACSPRRRSRARRSPTPTSSA